MQITARINTRNEEDTIAAALESVRWADELLVVDSGSADATVAVARGHGARVVEHPFAGYAEQHRFADSQCRHEWVLVLDADERVTPELAAAIQQLRSSSAGCDGYRMARRTQYLGRWIRHSGWYPDWKLRLYKRSAVRWEGGSVHERAEVNGPVGTLAGDLLHYTRRNLREHLDVMNRYTDLAASDLAASRRRPSWRRLALAPPAAFWRSYLWKQGFRDGWQGLVIAGLAASYVLVREGKLWEGNAGTFPVQTGSTPSEASRRGNSETP